MSEDKMLCDECGEEFNPGDLTQVFYHMKHEPVPVLETADGKPIRGRKMDKSLNTIPEVQKFVDSVEQALPDVSTKIDAPAQRGKYWFMDFNLHGRVVVAEYRPSQGYGVSLAEGHGYGEGPDEVYKEAANALDCVIKLLKNKD